jgi:hypothetical protein
MALRWYPVEVGCVGGNLMAFAQGHLMFTVLHLHVPLPENLIGVETHEVRTTG